MFDEKDSKGYNPFLATKKVLDGLKYKMRKGSTYVNNLGVTKVRSDFERGVAFGRYQLLCEQAKYYNENMRHTKSRYVSGEMKELDWDDIKSSKKYTTGGFDTL